MQSLNSCSFDAIRFCNKSINSSSVSGNDHVVVSQSKVRDLANVSAHAGSSHPVCHLHDRARGVKAVTDKSTPLNLSSQTLDLKATESVSSQASISRFVLRGLVFANLAIRRERCWSIHSGFKAFTLRHLRWVSSRLHNYSKTASSTRVFDTDYLSFSGSQQTNENITVIVLVWAFRPFLPTTSSPSFHPSLHDAALLAWCDSADRRSYCSTKRGVEPAPACLRDR